MAECASRANLLAGKLGSPTTDLDGRLKLHRHLNTMNRPIDHAQYPYPLDVKWEFWRIAGKIRNELDGPNEYESAAIAYEEAARHVAERVNALWIDKLCDPWFQ